MGLKPASSEFLCLGYCRFEHCPVTVTVTEYSEEDLKATVEFQGEQSIHNHTELKRRLVQAHDRDAIGHAIGHQGMTLELYAILDNSSEKACFFAKHAHVFFSTKKSLGLHGVAESLVLRKIWHCTEKTERYHCFLFLFSSSL